MSRRGSDVFIALMHRWSAKCADRTIGGGAEEVRDNTEVLREEGAEGLRGGDTTRTTRRGRVD
jgi:hypothetical protein